MVFDTGMLFAQVSPTFEANWPFGFCSIWIVVFLGKHHFCLLFKVFFIWCSTDLYWRLMELLERWLIYFFCCCYRRRYRVWLQTAFLVSLSFSFSRSVVHLMYHRPLSTDGSTEMLSSQVSLNLAANWRFGFCSIRIVVFLDEHHFCLLFWFCFIWCPTDLYWQLMKLLQHWLLICFLALGTKWLFNFSSVRIVVFFWVSLYPANQELCFFWFFSFFCLARSFFYMMFHRPVLTTDKIAATLTDLMSFFAVGTKYQFMFFFVRNVFFRELGFCWDLSS